jgi:hypothetical protein
MSARPVPRRHWPSYGNDPLPTGGEALDEPFSALPSWFMRISCDRCGKDQMLNEAHTAHRDLPIRTILDRMRHDGCGGRAGKAELLTVPTRADAAQDLELAAALRRRTTVPSGGSQREATAKCRGSRCRLPLATPGWLRLGG